MATCNVAQLLADGKCFVCLNEKQIRAIMAQMLCDMAAAVATCSDLFQDDFEELDLQGQRLLDPPWQNVDSCAFVYDSGAAQQEQSGEGGVSLVRASSFADGYAQAKTLGTGLHYVTLRWNDFGDNYVAMINEATDTLTLKRNGIGGTTLGTASVTFVVGSLLRLEAAGSRLTVKYGGVTVLSVVDTSPVLTAGKAGIGGNDNNEDYGAKFDDFECCSWD